MKTLIIWKPVKEPPKVGEDIIATYNLEQFEIGFYSACKEWSEGWCDFSFFKKNQWIMPTHWAYLSDLKPTTTG